MLAGGGARGRASAADPAVRPAAGAQESPWDTETSIHSRIRRAAASRRVVGLAFTLHHTAKATRVEPRRPEPQEPRAHRPHHDRRRRLRRARAHEPQAGADPVDRVPALIVVTTYPGASPEVVNNDVSTPIENAIQGVPGLESIDGDEHDERIDRAGVLHLRHRPRDRRAEDDAGDQPHLEPAARRRRAERHLGEHRRLPRHPGRRHRLRRRRDDPGAARGERHPRARGRRRRQRRPDRRRRRPARHDHARPGRSSPQAGYTQQAIRDALDQNGVLFPGGDITEDDQTLTVQTGSKVTSVDEIAALPARALDRRAVPGRRGHDRRRRDRRAGAGSGDDDLARRRRAGAHDRGHEAPVGEHRRRVERRARGRCPTSRTRPRRRRRSPSCSTRRPTSSSRSSRSPPRACSASSSRSLVILVFLLSVRATLVTAISIPTSVLITFIGIQAFGYSLNILTLGALTIAIGRVVDDSIVVIENIKRHYVGDADKTRLDPARRARGRHAPSPRRPSRRSPCSCRSRSSATSRASCSARSR